MVYKILGCIALLLALLVAGAWNFHTTVCTEHTFNASEADLWKVWTEASLVQKWWGPKGYTGLVVRNDVRTGGSYLWAMKSEQGKIFWNTGTYREVITNKRIVSTMSFSNENAEVIPGSQVSIPGHWPNEVTIIVDFSGSAGKARVTVREVGVPLIVYPLSRIGWAQQFDKIQSLL
jgi:uncharacterized protein YndB with AHSA1/START domain